MYNREIRTRIDEHLFKGRIIILYGARQVGKTTLVKALLNDRKDPSVYLNCDEPDVRLALEGHSSTELRSFIGARKLVVIDEAQRVRDIGLTLKLFADALPEVQIVATGSSSFELANRTAEALTGRKYEFHLFPLSTGELRQKMDDTEITRVIGRRMVFGMYPAVVENEGLTSVEILRELTGSYLYKDILAWKDIRRPEVLDKLLRALALQVGNEVSFTELAVITGVDKNTVETYLDVLEQAFIVFRLTPFSRNLRNELKKLRKVYFWDTGVRNALINNLNGMDLRSDAGALWENFMIVERIKMLNNRGVGFNAWFWRTHQQSEMDYVEEREGAITAVEFKWGLKKRATSRVFAEAYPGSRQMVVNPGNFMEFVTHAPGSLSSGSCEEKKNIL